MATTARIRVTVKRRGSDELKKMLEERRRELAHEVQIKVRDARTDSPHEGGVLDHGESSELDVQEAIGFALIQMKAETLDKIDTALNRIEQGIYGNCFECGAVIAKARLQALPLAVRCKECEEAHETAEQRQRITAQHLGSSALFRNV